VGIAKGPAGLLPGEQQAHMVDGISGATLTGKYLSQGLRRNLETYEPVAVRFRQGRPLDAREKTP
jgi:Na+-transporting NADH:ubiquinone oxidoreductase subunit C